MTAKHIPEAEFRAYTRRKRQELAQAIAESGLTITEIAAGTRMNWKTVQAIASGKAVRLESQDRVRCYLENVTDTEP